MLTIDELDIQRNTAIVVSNRLLQNSYFELKMLQFKTLLYTISKIKKDDAPNKEYKISIRELCQVCNMRVKGTNAYKGRNGIVYRAMRELRGKHLDLFDEQGRAFNTGWFSKVKMENDNDTVYYTFDSDLMPYLFNLSFDMGGLTITTLEIMCSLETLPGMRLYWFLRSIASLGKTQRITLDDIRDSTGFAGKYSLYADVQRYILKPAIDDINTYSDIQISYSPVKEGRKVVAIDFTISRHYMMDDREKEQRKLNRSKSLLITNNPNRQFVIKGETRLKYTRIYKRAKPNVKNGNEGNQN